MQAANRRKTIGLLMGMGVLMWCVVYAALSYFGGTGAGIVPIAVGIFPTKLPFLEVALPDARKYNMPDKNPISLGRVPVNPLPDTSKWVSLVSLKRTEGIVVPA